MSDLAALHEYNRDEWFDVMRHAKPDITREEFDEYWEQFQADKAERARKHGLQ